jgi:hypothetical protein
MTVFCGPAVNIEVHHKPVDGVRDIEATALSRGYSH